MKSKVKVHKGIIKMLLLSRPCSTKVLKKLVELKEQDKEPLIPLGKFQKEYFAIMQEAIRNTFISDTGNSKRLDLIAEALISTPFLANRKETELKVILNPLFTSLRILDTLKDSKYPLEPLQVSELWLQTSDCLHKRVKNHEYMLNILKTIEIVKEERNENL